MILTAVIIIVLGTVLRLWAWRHLDREGIQWQIVRVPACVVRSGPYRFINHPMYIGALLQLVGVGVLTFGWRGAVLALPALPFYIHCSVMENRMKRFVRSCQ